MNHIHRLIQERDEARDVIRRTREELLQLEGYLLSDKFCWPGNDYVHVRTDALPKITAIRFGLCGQ